MAYGYGSFSITSLFDWFGQENLVYTLLFVIFFIFISKSLIKMGLFRGRNRYGGLDENKGTAAIVGACVSLLASYGIYRSGFDIMDFFYGLGISSDSLLPILAIVLLLLIIFIIFKFKIRFSTILMILGLFLVAITIFTDLIYEKTIGVIIGIVIFLVGILIRRNLRDWWGRNVRTI